MLFRPMAEPESQRLELVILHVSANRAAYDAGTFLSPLHSDVRISGNTGRLPKRTSRAADLKKLVEQRALSTIPSDRLQRRLGSPATRAYFTFDYLGHGDQPRCSIGGWKVEERKPQLDEGGRDPAQGHFTLGKPNRRADRRREADGEQPSNLEVLWMFAPNGQPRRERVAHSGALMCTGWRIRPAG